MLEIAFVLVSAMDINIVIISYIILKLNIDRPTSISLLIILNVF